MDIQQLCPRDALLSPPVNKRTVLAAGYRFTEQGISSCAVNTSQPVGTVFAVSFVVYDLSIPSRSASVTRTIQIVNPCDAGRVLCSDGTCSHVACKFRSVMPAPLSISCCQQSASEQSLIQAFLLQRLLWYLCVIYHQFFVLCNCLGGIACRGALQHCESTLLSSFDTAVPLLQVSQVC